MGHLIGYARVSTLDQKPELQLDALKAAGCYRIFTDRASGSLTKRPELERCLDQLRPGDTLVVWKLDRLGRSLPHLVQVLSHLREQEIGFKSVTEGIDTTTAVGRLLGNLLGSLAEFERDLIRERTMAGLAAARARGRKGGRPVKMSPAKLSTAKRLHDEGNLTMQEIADVVGVSRGTLYRHLEPPMKAPAKPKAKKR